MIDVPAFTGTAEATSPAKQWQPGGILEGVLIDGEKAGIPQTGTKAMLRTCPVHLGEVGLFKILMFLCQAARRQVDVLADGLWTITLE